MLFLDWPDNGIDVSSGEYLVFVDGDDYVKPNHLSELYNGTEDFGMIQFVKKDGDILSEPNHFDFQFIFCSFLPYDYFR